MEDKQIITDVDKLQTRSEEINPIKENKLVKQTVLDLKNIIRHNKLLGCSAPLIGVDKRILVLNFSTDLKAFVDPIMNDCEDMVLNRETCECFPGKKFIIPRYSKISVQSFTPTGKYQTCTLNGLAAFAMQHEIDHLNGVLLSDIGFEIDDDFDDMSDDDKEKILRLYLDSIDEKFTKLEEEINADEQLKAMYDGMKFVHSVEIGETKLDEDDPLVFEQEKKDE